MAPRQRDRCVPTRTSPPISNARATRARQRGGAAAAAAFLERAAALTPTSRRTASIGSSRPQKPSTTPAPRGDALRLLDGAQARAAHPAAGARSSNGCELAPATRCVARAAVTRQLLAAAQRLEALDPQLARDTYIEALAAALYGGRLGNADEVADVADAILAATDDDDSDRAHDLMLRGQALLAAEGPAAAIPTLRRALRAFLDQPPDALELHWMWFASRAAQDLWDAGCDPRPSPTARSTSPEPTGCCRSCRSR